MHYRTAPGLILWVGPVKVTDRADGHELPDTPTVREHVRLGRLFRVVAAPVPENVPDEPKRRATKVKE
jgi:hypothetical protein